VSEHGLMYHSFYYRRVFPGDLFHLYQRNYQEKTQNRIIRKKLTLVTKTRKTRT